ASQRFLRCETELRDEWGPKRSLGTRGTTETVERIMANAEHNWTTIDVGGHPVEVLAPDEAPVGAVLWLHDVDRRSIRGQAVFERVFAEARLMAVCPQTGPCWWLDRLCPAFDDTISPM